jgi:predicted alpha/beta hydrolase
VNAAFSITANDPSGRPRSVRLLAADGYPVMATLYPAGPAGTARLLVAGATGVPQSFYRRFAEHASARGITTMTLDYRGIGLSRPASLRGFRMDYRDWARLDLAAAVEALHDKDQPLYMVGHSYGGHAFGLLPNHARVAAFYTFATGAGWHGWMPPRERARVWLMWNMVGPVLTKATGYLPWSRLGMGEDLPIDVYRQWKRWCQYPDYFFGDASARDSLTGFAQVRTPIMAANALDDLWAQPRSRDAFMAAYRGAPLSTLDIDPVAAGVGPIGHMGYFRARAQPLWDAALQWLDQNRVMPPAGEARLP